MRCELKFTNRSYSRTEGGGFLGGVGGGGKGLRICGSAYVDLHAECFAVMV